MNFQPLSIFLVKKGQGGDRLLFRYPYKVAPPKKPSHNLEPVLLLNGASSAAGNVSNSKASSENVPTMSAAGGGAISRLKYYKLPETFLDEDILSASSLSASASAAGSEATSATSVESNNLRTENLPEFPSKVLSNLFAVHPKLCDQKFELKINDVRFVGHPLSLEVKPGEQQNYARDIRSHMTMFQVVFALRAIADYSTVEIFHDLSQQIGVAIKYEERRCGYLSKEANILQMLQEDASSSAPVLDGSHSSSPFASALGKSSLAQSLKIIFEEISADGYCYQRINNYIEISFCMPQKVFGRLNPCLEVEPESVWHCLEALRPYHGLLLLYEERELLDKLPLDASPTLKKMLAHASPTKSFRTIASDSDLALSHVFHLAGHLLYWGMAIVIYPLCEANIYVVSPKIKDLLTPVVNERFHDKFPGENLVSCLALFSLPTSVAQRTAPILNAGHLHLLTKIIVWMLQQHLIIQLHTYVTLALQDDMSCHWEDPVEKMKLEKSQRKGPKVLERLNRNENGEETITEDYETILKAFSLADQQVILDVSQDKTELAKFALVAVYMNGKYHIEEIMYHLDLRRAQLLQIIDRFRDIIVRHEHEDPAVNLYYKPVRR